MHTVQISQTGYYLSEWHRELYNYLSNQSLSPLKLWVRSLLDTILCDKVCQNFTCGRAVFFFSPGTPVASTDETDLHDLIEILSKISLNTVT